MHMLSGKGRRRGHFSPSAVRIRHRVFAQTSSIESLLRRFVRQQWLSSRFWRSRQRQMGCRAGALSIARMLSLRDGYRSLAVGARVLLHAGMTDLALTLDVVLRLSLCLRLCLSGVIRLPRRRNSLPLSLALHSSLWFLLLSILLLFLRVLLLLLMRLLLLRRHLLRLARLLQAGGLVPGRHCLLMLSHLSVICRPCGCVFGLLASSGVVILSDLAWLRSVASLTLLLMYAVSTISYQKSVDQFAIPRETLVTDEMNIRS